MERIIPRLVILVVLITIMVWSLMMQRKSVARQKEAVIQAEESLNLNRKQVENQEKIIALLEEIRDSKTS